MVEAHIAALAEHGVYRACAHIGIYAHTCMQYDATNISNALAYVHMVRSKTNTEARDAQGAKLLDFTKEVRVRVCVYMHACVCVCRHACVRACYTELTQGVCVFRAVDAE